MITMVTFYISFTCEGTNQNVVFSQNNIITQKTTLSCAEAGTNLNTQEGIILTVKDYSNNWDGDFELC